MPQPLLWQQYTLGLGPVLCLTCEMGGQHLCLSSPSCCVCGRGFLAGSVDMMRRQAGRPLWGVRCLLGSMATLSAEETVFLLGMGCLDALFRKCEKEMGLLFAV